MTGVVLDVSVAASWAFADEESDDADDVLDAMGDGFALVPSLFTFELASTLAVALTRSRIIVDEVAEFVANLDQLDMRRDETKPDVLMLTLAAAHTGLSASDSSYLELARTTGLPIATHDLALRQAALSEGVRVFSLMA